MRLKLWKLSEYDIVTIRNTAYRFVLGNGSCGGGGLIIGEAMISSLSTKDLEDVTAEWKKRHTDYVIAPY